MGRAPGQCISPRLSIHIYRSVYTDLYNAICPIDNLREILISRRIYIAYSCQCICRRLSKAHILDICGVFPAYYLKHIHVCSSRRLYIAYSWRFICRRLSKAHNARYLWCISGILSQAHTCL